MLVHKIKNNLISMVCLATIGLTIITFTLIGCGGSGGGGGGSSSNSPPNNTPTQIPEIDIDRNQLAFGNVVQDNFSNQTISIQNRGTAGLAIGQIAGVDILSAPFSLLNDNCSGKSLSPTETCTLQIRFSPTRRGEFTDSFDIPSNDLNRNPLTVSVSGSGTGMTVSINQIYTDSCPTVTILATVTDKNGNLLPGLPQNSFSLSENGVLKAIAGISQVTSPISVTLALDSSESMRDSFPNMNAAAEAFIDQLNYGNNDEASLVRFAINSYLMQGFTSDKDVLKAAIYVRFPGDRGDTRLYDAIWFAIDYIATRVNRRAVIVLSDGKDGEGIQPSTRTMDEVIAYALEKGAPLFTIGLGAAINDEVMRNLATRTGGQFFVAPTSDQLQGIYLQIAEILAGQYLIEYSSSLSGGGPNTLEIGVDFDNMQGIASREFAGCP